MLTAGIVGVAGMSVGAYIAYISFQRGGYGAKVTDDIKKLGFLYVQYSCCTCPVDAATKRWILKSIHTKNGI
jgi:hypothetical protein